MDWLHKFKLLAEVKNGILERCERCGLMRHFPNNIPNHEYLAYHIRSILRADDPLFKKEYPEIKI